MIEGSFHRGVVDIMLATGLCAFLKVLAMAGSVSALLPEDFEDPAAPANLQEECASKCPDLDLNQVRIIWFKQNYSRISMRRIFQLHIKVEISRSEDFIRINRSEILSRVFLNSSANSKDIKRAGIHILRYFQILTNRSPFISNA